MAFELIDNWKEAYKFISVNCMVLASAIQGAWMYIPVDMKASIPPYLVTGATIALMVVGVIGRIKKQPDVTEEACKESQ